jgi:hypothetical protein
MLIPVVMTVAVVIVGLSMFRGSPRGEAPTPLPTPFPDATGQTWKIGGPIGAMSGQFWSIAGIPVRITDSTVVQSDVPISVGTVVEVTGIVTSNGTRVATTVSAGTSANGIAPATSNASPPQSPATTSTSPAQSPASTSTSPPLSPATTSMSPPLSPTTTNTSPATTPDMTSPPQTLGPTATAVPRVALQSTFDDLSGLRATADAKPNDNRMGEAIKHLSTSLDPSLWVDPEHLQRPPGAKVFNESKETVIRLRDMMHDQKNASSLLVLQSFVDRVRDANRGLVILAVNEAPMTGASKAAIGRAQNEMAAGDADATIGHSDSAIDHYHSAWEQISGSG